MTFGVTPEGFVRPTVQEIKEELERDELARGGRPSMSGTPSEPQRQLGLFQPPAPADDRGDRLKAALDAVDIDRITPLEALSLLAELNKQT